MADDWDDYDNDGARPSVKAPAAVTVAPSKAAPSKPSASWDDGDDDAGEDVKDDWDADSDEDKPKVAKPAPAKAAPAKAAASAPSAAAAPKVNKPAAAAAAKLSALEEKQRLQAAVESADLRNALDLFGEKVTEVVAAPPKTTVDFQKVATDFVKQMSKFEAQPEYQAFVERLIKDVLANQKSDFIKKISTMTTTMAATKQSEERAKASKAAQQTKANLAKRDLAGGASKKGAASIKSAINNYDEYYGDDMDEEDQEEDADVPEEFM